MEQENTSLLTVSNLSIAFSNRGEVTQAVEGISFSLKKGRALAIVGESGSGKSVTALSLTRLLPQPPTCNVQGEVFYKGNDLLKMKLKALRKIRGKDIAYIFQEPSTSLNPVFTVGYQIAEAVKLHLPEIKDVKAHVVKALDQVGIREPAERYYSYPHELSGGMQQRVMIAMAIACKPKILVADEATTALDVMIQKQIMDLFKQLRQTTDMAIILITHNFGIVSNFTDDVLVMFRGKIVEQGPTEEILKNPQHPYTRSLLDCIPRLGERKKRLTTIDYSKIGEFK